MLLIGWLVACPAGFAAQAPDLLSNFEINLSEKEKEALRLAAEWSDREAKPVHLGTGKVVYFLGATMPTVVAAPMHISDIELEPGEMVQDILVGDSQRWLIETGSSGSAQGEINHVFVKPVDSGLSTALVITTNKRVYHIKLVSQRTGTTPWVGFLYPEQAMALKRQSETAKYWQSTSVDGQQIDISTLNFNYKISGQAPWKPVQVYDTGAKMYIKMPDNTEAGEIPVLLALKGSKETLVNYRFRNNAFEVDGVFSSLILVTGVGWQQQKVTIVRGK